MGEADDMKAAGVRAICDPWLMTPREHGCGERRALAGHHPRNEGKRGGRAGG